MDAATSSNGGAAVMPIMYRTPTVYHAPKTREQWLQQAANVLALDWFAPQRLTVPSLNISVGIPYRARGQGQHAIGQHWHPPASANNIGAVFISPMIGDDTAQVVAVLAHEMVHAAVGNAAGHGKAFADAARKVGLLPPWTATTPSDGFIHWINAYLIPKVGHYPHPLLSLRAPALEPGAAPGPRLGPTGAPKQSTRLLRAECPSCGCVIRITRRWADLGLPRCACPDHKRFVLEA